MANGWIRLRWGWARRRRMAGSLGRAVAGLDLSDVAILAGYGMVVAGLWLVALPLALVVGGGLLLVAGVVRSW